MFSIRPSSKEPVRILLITFLGFAVSCTDNPFAEEDEVAPRTIRGKVVLLDGSSPDSVFVWLEDIRVSSWTDKKGEFVLSLPAPTDGGGVSGHNGTFSLYFYVANYGIQTAQVVLVNGDVARFRGDIGENGRLTDVVSLKRILNIQTDVVPYSFPRHYRGQIVVSVTLRAVSDDIIVETLKRVENTIFKRSGLIILDDEGRFINMIGQEQGWNLAPERITREGRSWNIVMRWPPCELPSGWYRMAPYILVRQEELPPELLEDLGEGVEELGPNYLTLPFRRDDGSFLIFE